MEFSTRDWRGIYSRLETTTTERMEDLTQPPMPIFDFCVILGLRPANESILPPLVSNPAPNTTTACPVGQQEIRESPMPLNITEQMCTLPATGVPSWEIALKVFSYSISILLALVGNALVIYVIVSSRRMRSRTNVFILNLALTDVCSPIFCMIPHLGNGITTQYPFPDFVCRMTVFMQVLKVTSGVFFLTWIAIDRFFAIVFPLKMGISTELLAMVLLCTWASACAVALPLLFYTERDEILWFNLHEVWCAEHWPAYYYLTEPEQNCLTETPTKTIFYTIYIILLYFMPIMVMGTVYVCIVYVLWHRPAQSGAAGEASRQRTRQKVVRMLFVLFLTFVVCYTPMQALILYDVYRSNDVEFPTWYNGSMYAATYLAYSNSAINPILYAGLNSNFRRSFKAACRLRQYRNKPNRIAAQAEANQTAASSSLQPRSSDFPSGPAPSGLKSVHKY